MHPNIPVQYKELSNVKGLENYGHYIVDVDGNVWSTKCNRLTKLKPTWATRRGTYTIVRLRGYDKKVKNYLVHRLIALAFIPTDDIKLDVIHKNKIMDDNRVENLEWAKRTRRGRYGPLKHKRKTKVRPEMITDEEMIELNVLEQFKKIHGASIRKGIKVPSDIEFMNNIINGALDDYINRYGLRKILQNL